MKSLYVRARRLFCGRVKIGMKNRVIPSANSRCVHRKSEDMLDEDRRSK